MSERAASFEALGGSLRVLRDGYLPLRALLREQREALVADDLARLEGVNERLTALLASLERLSAEQCSALRSVGDATLASVIQTATPDAADRLRPLHAELIALAEALQDQSSGNASLVRYAASVTDGVLRTVRSWAQHTYEAHGLSVPSRLGSRAWTI